MALYSHYSGQPTRNCRAPLTYGFSHESTWQLVERIPAAHRRFRYECQAVRWRGETIGKVSPIVAHALDAGNNQPCRRTMLNGHNLASGIRVKLAGMRFQSVNRRGTDLYKQTSVSIEV